MQINNNIILIKEYDNQADGQRTVNAGLVYLIGDHESWDWALKVEQESNGQEEEEDLEGKTSSNVWKK